MGCATFGDSTTEAGESRFAGRRLKVCNGGFEVNRKQDEREKAEKQLQDFSPLARGWKNGNGKPVRRACGRAANGCRRKVQVALKRRQGACDRMDLRVYKQAVKPRCKQVFNIFFGGYFGYRLVVFIAGIKIFKERIVIRRETAVMQKRGLASL